ncbi:MAG: signal peptidase [Patescibacteria group bacterium]|nr:signal peptidase [Patescibacteria group bacterium]
MINSFLQSIIDSFTDVVQNPVSIIIFAILSLLIVSLVLAMVFPFWRDLLVRVRFLEEDERPSSLLLWIVFVIIIVKLVQAFIIQPFIVDGGSMLPTFHNQEFLLVDKFSYLVGKPSRGDVMIFKLQEGDNKFLGKYLIKRVIGLPGERVVVKSGLTTIYNKDNPQGFKLDEPFVSYKETNKDVDVTLDEHHYFMMGDNRAQSYDSRDWGALHESAIRGKAVLRLLPLSLLSLNPGRHEYTK